MRYPDIAAEVLPRLFEAFFTTKGPEKGTGLGLSISRELLERFGGTLSMRDIGPADYLPGTGPPGLLQPGERADALIRIVDPGTEAVGFELDVCLPAGARVRCANPVATARQ